jgi:hypothetical protein
MKTKALASLALGCLLQTSTALCVDSSHDGTFFDWPYAEPLAGSALDCSGLNVKPAGSQGRIQVRDGHFVTADGHRIRFWGCNISSNENFPDEASARRLARRLAQGGINIARLHHLDNAWSVDSAGSLWKPGSTDRLHIDPAQLDKLHRLVAALKAEGIYCDVNLKVSRTLGPADGFPESIAKCPPFQKRVDYFDERMIRLQEDYARQLLSAKNPYTGLSLAEDPAVAMVELNNENSLLGMRSRDVGSGLELLPEPFRGELEDQWSAWLRKHYKDSAQLSAAWADDATIGGHSPVGAASAWHPDVQPGNELHLEAGDDLRSVHLSLLRSDTVRWRSGAYLDALELGDNETYTLSFRARADRPRPLIVAVGRDEASWRTDKWRTLGLNATLQLGTDWSSHRLVFVSHSVVDLPARLALMVGHSLGEVWLEDIRLESGSASAGLHQGQDPWTGRVPVPTDPTPAQWRDWVRFLSDTEVAYVARLRKSLTGELGVKAPIVCSQANYGGIAGLLRERASDFIDSHCYWQHPDFGGLTGSWDTANYTILNSPQLAEFGPRWFGEIGGIAQLRVKGKPFTVTEMDHPAPSEFACEFYPEFATFGCLQDWDALFPFDATNFAQERDPGELGSFFDQGHHPAKWGFAPFATRCFREGLIEPLASVRELQVPAQPLAEARHLDVLWLRTQPGKDLGFLQNRLEVEEKLLPPGQPARVLEKPGTLPSPAQLLQGPHGPVYAVESPVAVSMVGFLGGDEVSTRSLGITCPRFGRDFAALTALSLDGKPLELSNRVLITLVARAGNSGMEWNAARSSLGTHGGKAPTIAEHVPARIRLCHPGPGVLYPLAPDGSRLHPLTTERQGAWLRFSTEEGPRTLHYEWVGSR